MGRTKLVLKKIENKAHRHITFAKRKTGLVKKAYELSTLCDVEVALIIFSPAGKLILFEGKKRLEEIVLHYLDSPARNRGRLPDQESISRIISQMNLEAGLHHHNSACPGTSGSFGSIYSQLEDVQKQILIVTSQLQDVENQLQYFVKSPACIKSLSDLEFCEKTLENTLQVVRMRKEALEAQNSIPPTLEAYETQFYPQTSSSHGSLLDSWSYNLMDWPSQSNFQFPGNFAQPNGFQPRRNGLETLAGLLPSPITYIHGHGYLAGNEISNRPGQVANNVLNPGSGIFKFSPTMDIMQQPIVCTCTTLHCTGCYENYSNLDPGFWFPH